MTNSIELDSLEPSQQLAPYIESYWIIKNDSDHDEELITFPDGGIDLYFFHSQQYPVHVSLVGLETHSQIATMPKHSALCGIRFKFLAAEYLLKTSVASILNDRLDLNQDFAGIQPSDLQDFERFCYKLERYLLAQCPDQLDLRKQKISELVYQSKGAIGVAEAAKQSNWSSRQINRYFHKWLGLPLKSYCDILRFNSSFESLKMGVLFPEADFTDQSHYIKLIKKYSNLTPKQLAQGRNDRFIQLSPKA